MARDNLSDTSVVDNLSDASDVVCPNCDEMLMALRMKEKQCSYWEYKATTAGEDLKRMSGQLDLVLKQVDLMRTQMDQLREEKNRILDQMNVFTSRPPPPPPPQLPPPSHLAWVAAMPSLWKQTFKPESPSMETESSPCSWHGPAQLNVSGLRVVVNEYNTVTDDADISRLFVPIEDMRSMDSQFTSLEVTVFRSNRLSWNALQQKIKDRWSHGHVLVLRSHSRNNRWFLTMCPLCGDCVFVPYDGTGKSPPAPDAIEVKYRHSLFRFFRVPIPTERLQEV